MQEQEKLKGSAQYLGQLFREMQVGDAGCCCRRFSVHWNNQVSRMQECSRGRLLDSEAAICLATSLVAALPGAALQGEAQEPDTVLTSATTSGLGQFPHCQVELERCQSIDNDGLH